MKQFSSAVLSSGARFGWFGLFAVCFSLENPIGEQGGVLRQEGIGTKQDYRTQEDLL